ncbi:hypothetical protein E1212_20125 [Jiangella ureilytica]|uniref:Uncharacterized protein n=1 Tax=Jiangella ureilytica TaxID=2530374 RepID=A0A4R4RHP9_9ACTN|nr:hypothetical protein [Jiangella ureilytica]TDC48796.1 hypothetical protein E1212_20125 [Jiangella ureilytica]
MMAEVQVMFAAHRATAVVAVVVVVLVACGGGGSEPSPSPAPTTDPAITAPPALTAEQQAEAEIRATFEELITSWDDFKANASDYGGTPGWNAELVGQWNVEGAANADLANWIAAWRSSEIEQIGSTSVANHEVLKLDYDVTDHGVHEATSVGCLDMSQLDYVDYLGATAQLPAVPPSHQRWQMSWSYAPAAHHESGTDEPGWYLGRIVVALDEPC